MRRPPGGRRAGGCPRGGWGSRRGRIGWWTAPCARTSAGRGGGRGRRIASSCGRSRARCRSEQAAQVGVTNKRLTAGWDARYLLEVITGYEAIALRSATHWLLAGKRDRLTETPAQRRRMG